MKYLASCIFSIALLAGSATASAQAPSWLETVNSCIDSGEFSKASKLMKKLPAKVRRDNAVKIDSLNQIMERIRHDFTLTPAEGIKQIKDKMPDVTTAQIDNWKAKRNIETMTIDGQEWWFRKAVRNLWLLGAEFKTTNDEENQQTAKLYRKYFIEAMQHAPNADGARDWRRVNVTFTLDVNADAVPAGETLRVWLPFPYENLRQRDIKLISSNRPVTMSKGSLHHTVYMEAQAQKGKPTHFEYTMSYLVAERHVAQSDMLMLLEPYDTSSAVYKRYTASQPPHIVLTDSLHQLALQIVGNETNPVLQASKIYDWISANFPWAGAREYSTIRNMPTYVLANGHGDCGQVALLYITLVRSLGIPARWESGYMLHPGEVNFHDWAETYFEGIGWVPTDPSFGRSTRGTVLNDYYKSGLDIYRFASNEGIGDALSPAKKYIRSETVDFQSGEVEWRKGNLYYGSWSSHFQVNSITSEDNTK